MALEGLAVRQQVWSLLVADSGAGGVNTLLGGTPTTPGRIYQDVVPAAVPLPAITIALVAAIDGNTVDGTRVMTRIDVDVAVRGDGTSYGPLSPIARRANVVLQGSYGTYDGVYSYRFFRTDEYHRADEDSGKRYTSVIQTYHTDAHDVAAAV